MNYYVWLNHHVEGPKPLKEVTEGHRHYLQTHEQIVLGGSYFDKTGGMLLIIADSIDEAKSIVEGDPMIINNHLSYELHEWKMQINNLGKIVK